jgi:hypothetical protein
MGEKKFIQICGWKTFQGRDYFEGIDVDERTIL